MKAYQLKIVIKGSKPPIWRRVIIPEKITFLQLHLTIQSVFCWYNYHLYEFEFPEDYIQVVDNIEKSDGGNGQFDEIDASETIDKLVSGCHWFKYVYDFGDWWEHIITVEKIITDYEVRYPQVLKYKGDIIPEDCGGIWGYYDLVEGIDNNDDDTDDEELEEGQEWELDHELRQYNMAEVNDMMKRKLVFQVSKKKKQSSKKNSKDVEVDFSTFIKELEVNDYFDGSFDEDTLDNIYSFYAKYEIIDIAKKHQVTGYSKYNKKDLIPYVIEYILKEEPMKRYFHFMHDSEIEAFEDAMQEDAYIPSEQDDEYEYEYLYSGGYCGMDSEFGIVIPNEVARAYKKIDTKAFHKKRKRLSLIGSYLNAANNLYAITSTKILIDMFNQNEKEELTEEELLAVYNEIKPCRCDFTYIDGMFVENKLVQDNVYLGVIQQQLNKPYYIPDKEEILCLGRYGHQIITDELKKIYVYLTDNMDITNDIAIDACYQMQINMRIGCEIQEIINDLTGLGAIFKKEKQRKEFTGLLMKLWNNTRTISNRGYTHTEIAKMQLNQKHTSNVVNFPVGKQ